MFGVSFLYPRYLFFLLVIPFILLVHFVSLRVRKSRPLKFANFEALSKIKGIDIYSKNLSTLFISIAIAILLTLSISGMTLTMPLPASSFSYVIAVDNSQSMGANDVLPSRISAAKQAALDFANILPFGSRMGVVSFSSASRTEQVLTSDKELINNALSGIDLSNSGGTDLSGTVMVSVDLLSGEENKAVIIMSDGQFTDGDLTSSIKYAKDNNVTIYTFAVGTSEGGQTFYGISKTDEDTLKAISYGTGGKFFSVSSKEDLKSSFYSIIQTSVKDVVFNISRYLALVALILFVIEYALYNTRYASMP